MVVHPSVRHTTLCAGWLVGIAHPLASHRDTNNDRGSAGPRLTDYLLLTAVCVQQRGGAVKLHAARHKASCPPVRVKKEEGTQTKNYRTHVQLVVEGHPGAQGAQG